MDNILCERFKISIETFEEVNGDQIFVTITNDSEPDDAIVLVGENAYKVIDIVKDLLKQLCKD